MSLSEIFDPVVRAYFNAQSGNSSGGGSGSLIVRLSEDLTSADHTYDEIRERLEDGGSVMIHFPANGGETLLYPTLLADGAVMFISPLPHGVALEIIGVIITSSNDVIIDRYENT